MTALLAPKFITRLGGGTILAGAMVLSLIGMFWLARASTDSTYWSGLAVPMLLIGIGQGGSLGPLTTSGIAGVKSEDAGAASGLVNAAHQLGSSLGLSVGVAASAFGGQTLEGTALLAHRTANALTAGAAFVALALVVAVATIPHKSTSRSAA